MLKKVLKYDLKYIYKVITVFYVLELIFAIFTRILFSFDNSTIINIIAQISSGFTISFIFNILINNMMRSWTRFIKNIYSDESYLTHTLPISKRTIYISKFLSTIITMFTSILVILLSVFIAYYSKENLDLLKSSLTAIATIYDGTVIKLLLVVFFVFFLEMAFIIQSGYTGIILGHKSNNNKMAKSIVYGFISYIAAQIISLLIIFIIGLFNKDIMNLFLTNNIGNLNILKYIMYIAIFIYIIYLYIYYKINLKLFNQGVNVE